MSNTKLVASSVDVSVPETTTDARCEEICDRVDTLLENMAAVISNEFPEVEVHIS